MTNTLIFDGDCGFCTSTANFIEKNSSVKIDVQPYQWAKLADLGLTEKEAAAKVQLVSDGKIYAGHHCMAKLLLLQPNPVLKFIGAVMVMPSIDPISAKVYDWVASNRQSFPGGTPACKMPKKD
jgi:predicted DCC family thiol-disulfide oxidoreductase YuxK